MKKIRGIVVLAAVLAVLAFASVVQAGGPGGVTTSSCENIVWCTH